MRDDMPVNNGDEIIECLKNLSLENHQGKSKDTYNILVDETKNEKDAPENDNNNIKVESKEIKKEILEDSVKSNHESDKIEEKEKSEDKSEQLGELCARGPEPKTRWASQARNITLPYSTSHQSNAILTNGGCIYHNPPQTQLGSEICYTNLSLGEANEISQEYDCQQQSAEVPGDNNQFINNIHEVSNLCDILPCEKFSPLSPPSPAKGESQSDPYVPLKEIIREITSDPEKRDNVLIELIRSLPEEVQTLPESQISLSSPSTYRDISPNISSQVIPNGQLSPYSTSSGSPLGPSSPSLYANTPNYSPNVPSPRGYLSDDSSNHMYGPTSYCNSIVTPPRQRPLSSCSLSSSTTNQSYPDGDIFDLDVICIEPQGEAKRRELKVLQQELDSTCSQACSETEALNMSPSIPINSVPLSRSQVVITTIIPAQSSAMLPPNSNGSNQGTPRLRKILPKPSENSMIPQQSKAVLSQNIPCRQQMNHNRMIQKKSLSVAKNKLLERCSEEKIKTFWVKAQACHDEKISSVDRDGDTCLMILVCDRDLKNKLEQLYALVERCKCLPEVLCAKNKDKLSALHMACFIAYRDPLVAKYIAEAMVEVQADMNMVDDEGSTLIHQLCKEGDKYAEVLNELLSLQDIRGKQCFDINRSDYEGRTPLHLAVEIHNKREVSCLEIVRVLLKNGADVLKKDTKQGSTPLHFAVATDKADLNLIKTLCNTTRHKYDIVNALNYKGDTPLHVAMACGSSIEQPTHNAIVEFLMGSGASRAMRNLNGKAPLELAPDLRKADLKKILDKYNVK